MHRGTPDVCTGRREAHRGRTHGSRHRAAWAGDRALALLAGTGPRLSLSAVVLVTAVSVGACGALKGAGDAATN
ncbi:hypothetical protein GCM10010129_77060 [Streptomyces fumigatiscleroticus]|nr:hypothetical protein GCM10010129_77060 [Streptomyces fumigatiscleroticus]